MGQDLLLGDKLWMLRVLPSILKHAMAMSGSCCTDTSPAPFKSVLSIQQKKQQLQLQQQQQQQHQLALEYEEKHSMDSAVSTRSDL